MKSTTESLPHRLRQSKIAKSSATTQARRAYYRHDDNLQAFDRSEAAAKNVGSVRLHRHHRRRRSLSEEKGCLIAPWCSLVAKEMCCWLAGWRTTTHTANELRLAHSWWLARRGFSIRTIVRRMKAAAIVARSLVLPQLHVRSDPTQSAAASSCTRERDRLELHACIQ